MDSFGISPKSFPNTGPEKIIDCDFEGFVPFG